MFRTELAPAGATFTTETNPFLQADWVDFHPTDVIEDADGSLLVVDTGGWYKLCCPTSQLEKPAVLGAIYRVRRDGTGLECLYENTNDEFVVHETFLGRTGDLVYTVWPHALMRMNWATRERRVIAEFNAWHITPNRDGTLVLCDTNHPDEGLHLVEVATGKRTRLCLSQASSGGSQWKTSRYALAEDFARARSEAKTGALSWMEVAVDTVYGPQWTHPHPSFSHDETKVVFASDKSGHTQVYVVERS